MHTVFRQYVAKQGCADKTGLKLVMVLFKLFTQISGSAHRVGQFMLQSKQIAGLRGHSTAAGGV